MRVPFGEIAASLLLISSPMSTESGGFVGAIPEAASDARIAGTWTSYTPTRFGMTTAEFFADGTCRFRLGEDETHPCKWQGTGNGRKTIFAVVSGGRTETYVASVSGDTMVIKAPGRETPAVRADST